MFDLADAEEKCCVLRLLAVAVVLLLSAGLALVFVFVFVFVSVWGGDGGPLPKPAGCAVQEDRSLDRVAICQPDHADGLERS